jgi:site-specific recombinase XerD
MDATPPPLTLDEALAQYRGQYLTSRNLAERTRVHYSGDLTDLLRYVQERCRLTRVDQVQRRHLEGYLAELDRRGLKGSSRRRKVAAIRSFFGYLAERSLIPGNPSQQLLPPAREEGLPRGLSEQEYKRLLDAVRFETRDAAIIELLLQTGIRLSECAGLTLSDIALPAKITKDEGNVGAVTVKGKGRKTLTITLNWKACKALKAYLAVRPKVDDPHLFLTKFKQGIGPPLD